MSDNYKNTGYSTTDIEKYLKGELSAPEMHKLEKASLEDPFLADAWEGMEKESRERGLHAFQQDLSELEKRLSEKSRSVATVVTTPASAAIRPVIARTSWRIAASVILVAGLGALSYYLIDGNRSFKERPALVSERAKTARETVPAPSSPQTQNPKAETGSTSIPPATGNDRAKLAPLPVRDAETAPLKASSPAATAPAIRKPVPPNYAFNKPPAHALPPDKNANTVTTPSIGAGYLSDQKRPPLAANLTKPPAFTAPEFETVASNSVFAGKVLDTENKPIFNATIVLNDRSFSTLTDSDGVFVLNLKSPDSLLDVTVKSIGYQPLTTTISSRYNSVFINNQPASSPFVEKPSTEDGNIAYGNFIHLKPAANALNEVVVSGYGDARRSKVLDYGNALAKDKAKVNDEPRLKRSGNLPVPGVMTQNAQPSAGWDEYNSYLLQHKKISTADSTLSGNEIISFFVDRKGVLSSFTIERSLSPAHDLEAIRLVMQGPSWKLLKGRKEKTTLVIPF